jgi:hypothetical protein
MVRGSRREVVIVRRREFAVVAAGLFCPAAMRAPAVPVAIGE